MCFRTNKKQIFYTLKKIFKIRLITEKLKSVACEKPNPTLETWWENLR